MITCFICDCATNPDGSVNCVECGANLQTRKYTKADDPNLKIKELEQTVNELKEEVKKKNEPPTKPVARRPLFG